MRKSPAMPAYGSSASSLRSRSGDKFDRGNTASLSSTATSRFGFAYASGRIRAASRGSSRQPLIGAAASMASRPLMIGKLIAFVRPSD
jgi:hypothetical protein